MRSKKFDKSAHNVRASILKFVRWIAVLLCVAISSFVVMDLLPGDAATIIARTSDPARIAAVRSQLGLDQPLLIRLGDWFTRLFLFGDGGNLFASHRTVWEASAVAARNSVYLVAVALPALMLIGVGTGILAGLKPTSWRDRLTSTGAQATLAVPEFAVTSLLLFLLAGIAGIAPAVSLIPPGGTPADNPKALIIPALSLALIGGAWQQRLIRATIVDAQALPHVRAAHISGMHPFKVACLHTLPAAFAPIAQICAATVPYIVTGTVVVENVVGYPGIGTAITHFITARETIAVATLTTVFAAITITSFLIADVLGSHR